MLATADYGEPFAAVVGQGNVYGTQSHPEKSSAHGLALLANFTRLCGRAAVPRMNLYPAIDILDGNAVRLSKGDFDAKKVYDEDPLAAARGWTEEGARHLHVVDLDGAKSGAPVNLDHLRRSPASSGVPVQYGGGLRSAAAVERSARRGSHARDPGHGRVHAAGPARAGAARARSGAGAGVGGRARRPRDHGRLDGDDRDHDRGGDRQPRAARGEAAGVHQRRPRRDAARGRTWRKCAA